MRKAFFLFTVLMMLFTLSACNETAKPVNEGNGEKSSGNESSLTLGEIFDKSMEATNEIKSFSLSMDLDQKMKFGDETQTIKSTIDMNFVKDPMTFHQKLSMEMDGMSEKLETESYFSKDGLFFYDPDQDVWMKFPTEMSDQILQMSGQQSNPVEEMKKLEKFIDDFTFEQDDKHYILKLNASGEKFEQLIKETVEDTLPNEMKATMDVLDEMKIHKVYYEYLIDKKTFLPVEIAVDMDMEMSVEDQVLKLEQKTIGKYKEYNKISEIIIPQEVINKAVEIQM